MQAAPISFVLVSTALLTTSISLIPTFGDSDPTNISCLTVDYSRVIHLLLIVLYAPYINAVRFAEVIIQLEKGDASLILELTGWPLPSSSQSYDVEQEVSDECLLATNLCEISHQATQASCSSLRTLYMGRYTLNEPVRSPYLTH